MSNRILIVDDELDICQLLSRFLAKNGFETEFVTSGKKAIAHVKKNIPDLILCDFRLPDMDGIEALKAFKEIKYDIKIIIITGYSDVKTAVKCVKLGASEYVTKPIFPEEILVSVKSALKEATVPQKNAENAKFPKKNLTQSQNRKFIEGKSIASQKLRQVINLLAPTNMSVIIQGESGTGKEMVATEIHQKSKRSSMPFVAIDCGALPKELAASELFGHVKGSFTGAINNKVGHFEMANGGTLFLDEIGNLSYENQIKLLRVLQERKIRKIGDNKDITIDVRLITASNDNLEELAKEGGFREDLFYRLNEFLVDVSPLRNKKDDILIYAKHFLSIANKELEKEVKELSPEVEEILLKYKWPGNLRELKNVIKRAVLFTEGNIMQKISLPKEIVFLEEEQSYKDGDEITNLKEVAEKAEREAIIKVLELNDYNKTKTARILKIDRKTLYNKLESYDIQFKKILRVKKLKVLLIDDSEYDYEIINHKLSGISIFSFSLDWYNNYKAGKRKINDSKYDIILLDTNLPDGSGLDLLKYARDNNNTKPIIIITGVSNREHDLRALAEGADDYIIKTDLADTSLERSLRYCYEGYLTKLKITQREERYRNLFEKSLDSIAIINKNFVFHEVNQSMATLLETSVNTLAGEKLKDFFSEKEDFISFREMVNKWGLVKKHKVNLRSKKNKKIIGEITSIVLFSLQNKISGYQIIIKDLTKEKINEQRIIRAEKLGMTGRIARSIAHEVRNPLTNINLAVEQLKEDIPKEESNDMYIDIINRNSNRINKLITELLNSSKPSNVKRVNQSIRAVIEEAISLATDRIHLHSIELTTLLKSDYTIKFDEVQLKTALLNIIINAIEAMEDKKGKLSISLEASLNEVHIKISDNGIGIDSKTLNQLFDPFFTGKMTGMGLGLTSTQNIIQQHNGNIDVESELGKGTTFIINLPK